MRRHAIVRDSADINRLILHLFTHWTMPRVDLQIGTPPALAVQFAQHRIGLLAERCNCLLASVLAIATMLGGSYIVWTLDLGQRALLWVLLAVIYAGFIGKGLDIAWNRFSVTRVLWRLRTQLGSGEPIALARYEGRKSPDLSRGQKAAKAFAANDADVENDSATPRLAFARAARPKVVLHGVADVEHLMVHLLTHWNVPQVEIALDGLPALDTQRAQHRIRQLSAACNCMLGASLAGLTMLGGAFVVQWTRSYNWDWMVPESWGALAWVPAAALAAGVFGWMVEAAWTRVSLLRVLQGLRHPG